MMIRFGRIIWILSFVLLFGCNDEDNEYQKAMEQEERYFDLYVNANYPELDSLESGLYYINYEEGTGESPDSGDWVLVNYIAFTIPDETVVDTYVEEWAIDYNLYNRNVLYGPYKYMHGTEVEGLMEGVSMMKEGGVSRLLFKSNLGYGKDGSANIGGYASLMYDVELVEVIGQFPSDKELAQIKEYLDEHPGYISIYDEETDAIMYVYHLVSGDSTFVKEGQSVEVYYTGKLLDGREFDSNEGESSGLNVIVGDEEVIRGWDIALPYLRYGSTGRFLIPHQLGYGEEGSFASNTTKTSIPPYEALLFDVEITKSKIEEKD